MTKDESPHKLPPNRQREKRGLDGREDCFQTVEHISQSGKRARVGFLQSHHEQAVSKRFAEAEPVFMTVLH